MSPLLAIQEGAPRALGVLALVWASLLFLPEGLAGWLVNSPPEGLLRSLRIPEGYRNVDLWPPSHLDTHKYSIPSPVTWPLGVRAVRKHDIL